ncbi:MAG: hypothetical protein AMJ91_00730 [candidate division Zixibacteria bacterium SM23_73_3]|nr:MAG: hypothetical protein AMJ91_00730 [candidate division Zixibacteria bacterium SM23_73_3]
MRINYTNKLSAVIFIFLFVWIFAFTPDPAWGSCRIENISLKKEGNFTKVCVYADKPFEFSHSTEEAKDGKPYRVIIDCRDAVFGLPRQNYKMGLPPGMIMAIRTSQFQAVPERIVRVVLDLKGPVVYKVIDTGIRKEATIAVLTTQDPDFPMWSAIKEKEKDQEMAMVEKQTAVPSTASGSKEKLISDQEEDKTQKDVSASSAKLALKSTRRIKVEDKGTSSVTKSGSKQSFTKRSSLEREISRYPVPLGPFPEDASSLAEASEETKVTEAKVEKKDVPLETLGSVQKEIGKILGPEPVAARETQALPESLILIQSAPQSELSLIPQRKMICYNSGNKRDPFLPLTERRDMSFGEAPPPLFENLTLVGVLKDEEGNRALLEDEEGFGYILMSGDRIKNGYVISVEDDRVIFHVEEYGGYQIMVLELNREY